MIKNYFFFGVLFLCALSLQAQFTDDMESYTDGEPINGAHWTDTGCGGGEGCSIMSSSIKAHSGNLSGYIPGDGTTRAVLDLGNKIFGYWGISLWVFIPEGKEAVMSLQGTVPFEEGNSIVGDITFNKDLLSPGVGVVSDSALGEVSFNFPHNEWFRIVMNFDISLGINMATWLLYIDDVFVIDEGTPFTNENGEYPSKLGGIEFFSISTNNELFIDDLIYQDWGPGSGGCFPDGDPFTDSMEYENGEPLEDWWETPIAITNTQSNSGEKSGVIPDDGITDVILDLGNITSGEWDVEFYMYVSSNKEAYWNIQGYAPNGGSFVFNQNNSNPGVGLIENTHQGDVTFNFPHDDWFSVSMRFDFTQGMSGATWEISIDETEVLPEGSPFTNEAGDVPSSLGGINFLSISTDNLYYIDDVELDERQLGIVEVTEVSFKMYPNPSNDIIHIQSNEVIKNISIYNVLGSRVLTTSEINAINISSLAKGMYFVVVETEMGRGTQKLIKK